MLPTLDASLSKVKNQKEYYAMHLPIQCMSDKPCLLLCPAATEEVIEAVLIHEGLHHALCKMFQREIKEYVEQFNKLNEDLDRFLEHWEDAQAFLDKPKFKRRKKIPRKVKTCRSTHQGNVKSVLVLTPQSTPSSG
jgi:hypothetical protein